MFLLDISAIDKLIDYNNENTLVEFNDKIYPLYDLKEYFIDNRMTLSLDHCIVNHSSIFYQGAKYIEVKDLRIKQKDDLIDL